MIKPLHALIYMLQGRVILEDNTDVRIIKREYPIDKTPCITIDDSTEIIQRNITNKDYKLDTSHPQYDETNPDKKISQQVIREEKKATLDLNIWCDSEDDRDEITDKILALLYQVQSDYYQFCKQYDNGNCTTLDETCKVNDFTGRGVKHQCPHPTQYNYQNVFSAYDIIRSSFNVEPPYTLDELDTQPAILRSIIRVEFSYYDYYNIGGAVSPKLIVDEELL